MAYHSGDTEISVQTTFPGKIFGAAEENANSVILY